MARRHAWTGARAGAALSGTAHAAGWVTDHVALLPGGARVLDVACGHGRHARWLARRGLLVHAIDRDAEALRSLHADAPDVVTTLVDLETDPPPDLGHSRYDGIVVVNYLHRPLFPALLAALAPGGHLIYETFTLAQASRGRPTNPAFLLRPGELRELVAPLTIVDSREGDYEGRWVASIVATRPSPMLSSP